MRSAKMNKRIKSAWVKALKSGKYKQGRCRLHDPETHTYCCLGVLCDLHAKTQKKSFRNGTYLGRRGFLPTTVVEWAGLSGRNPDVKYRGSFVWLSQLNDDGIGYKAFNFKKIADIIEKQL